ncbi:MAG TPA: hypothetical protein VHX59_00635 [Mycobacteriales bacterium]|jgi:hypothetical protein|nr:hypothetical protein [Mycobacteriales bacterium]
MDRGHAGHGQRHAGRGRWRGEYGRWQQGDLPPAEDAADWIAGRLPDEWFEGAPEVTVDREEIVIVGTLPAPETAPDATAEARAGAEAGRIARFREETRDARIGIAQEAEARYGRKVAWGARIGDTGQLFTSAAVPVMTRLRQPDRRVLDTLVDAGVARSRADALVWCVRLVGEHADSWLDQLREAMTSVDEVRTRGPEL